MDYLRIWLFREDFSGDILVGSSHNLWSYPLISRISEHPAAENGSRVIKE